MSSQTIKCPPPSGFKPAGNVIEAHFSQTPPPFIRKTRVTGRKAQGIRYERKVQEYLEERYGQKYVRSPWCRYRNDAGWHWCQPDGLLLQSTQQRVIIIEVKYQHTSNAWWQVERQYRPVIAALFPGWDIGRVEVVKWFDPILPFPERTILCENVENVPYLQFGVHIWKP